MDARVARDLGLTHSAHTISVPVEVAVVAAVALGFNFVHLLPLLLIFVFSLLSAPSYSEDAPFSLQRTDYYVMKRHVGGDASSGMEYFVSTGFSQRYTRDPRALAQVEAQVSKDYFKTLETKCNAEKHEQQQLMKDAKKSKGPSQQEKLDKAHNFQMPSCVRLQTLAARS